MLRKLIVPLITGFLLLSSLGSAYAQDAQIPESLRQTATNPCPADAVSTGLGCIQTTAEGFTNNILRFAVGIAGMVGLLLLLYGFFILSTSAGNPDKVKAGKEIITSAIGGLIFVVMSTVLMYFIGVNILAIPGLD